MQIITAVVMKADIDMENAFIEYIDKDNQSIILAQVQPTRESIAEIKRKEYNAKQRLNRQRLRQEKKKLRGDSDAWTKVIKANRPLTELEDDYEKEVVFNSNIDYLLAFDTKKRKLYKVTLSDIIKDIFETLEAPIKYSDGTVEYYTDVVHTSKGLSHDSAQKLNISNRDFLYFGKNIKAYTIERRVAQSRSYLSNIDLTAANRQELKAEGYIRENIIIRTSSYNFKYPIIIKAVDKKVICATKDYLSDINTNSDIIRQNLINTFYLYDSGDIYCLFYNQKSNSSEKDE